MSRPPRADHVEQRARETAALEADPFGRIECVHGNRQSACMRCDREEGDRKAREVLRARRATPIMEARPGPELGDSRSTLLRPQSAARETRAGLLPFSPPERATLGQREAREYGIEPHPAVVQDARTLPAFAKLGKRCKACGGGAAHLENHPELDYCTPQCEAYGAKKAQAVRISSVLDIPLGIRAPIAAALLEHATVPALAEDRAASDMFDGDEPPEEEPVVDVADYVSGLERDAQAAHEELRRVMVERDEAIEALDRAIDANRVLQQQLDAALEEIEAMRRTGCV